jgi:hypothetical protein
MNRLFILRGDLVINAVVVDPDSDWQAPDDCTTMPIPDDSPGWIGWRYVDGEWIAPPPMPEPEPDEDLEPNP